MRHVLFVTNQLLYGPLPNGFYPEKAATNESKITSQVRCACIGLWESCLPVYFNTNNMFDSLQTLLLIENEMTQTTSYPFWLNLLMNRISMFISRKLRLLFPYEVKDILGLRTDGENKASPMSGDPVKGITRFLLKQHDDRCVRVCMQTRCLH